MPFLHRARATGALRAFTAGGTASTVQSRDSPGAIAGQNGETRFQSPWVDFTPNGARKTVHTAETHGNAPNDGSAPLTGRVWAQFEGQGGRALNSHLSLSSREAHGGSRRTHGPANCRALAECRQRRHTVGGTHSECVHYCRVTAACGPATQKSAPHRGGAARTRGASPPPVPPPTNYSLSLALALASAK